MICKCGGKVQKRITDEGRCLECVACGCSEVEKLISPPDLSKFDYSLPDDVFKPRSEPVGDIGNELIRAAALRKQKSPRKKLSGVIARLMESQHKLNRVEQQFVATMDVDILGGAMPSDKQTAWLHRLDELPADLEPKEITCKPRSSRNSKMGKQPPSDTVFFDGKDGTDPWEELTTLAEGIDL